MLSNNARKFQAGSPVEVGVSLEPCVRSIQERDCGAPETGGMGLAGTQAMKFLAAAEDAGGRPGSRPFSGPVTTVARGLVRRVYTFETK